MKVLKYLGLNMDGVLQWKLNRALKKTKKRMFRNNAKLEEYKELFDSASNSGFYDSIKTGDGQKPTWDANPAYLRSAQEFVDALNDILDPLGFQIDKIDDLYPESVEFRDFEHSHRRVFSGFVMDSTTSRKITSFMLTVPHSHKKFDYPTSPYISLSKRLIS